MRKLLSTSAILAGAALQTALATDIKPGILFGFTDPVESVAANRGPAAELDKALKIIADGGDIDYIDASAVELICSGESAGNYREIRIEGGKVVTVKVEDFHAWG